MSEYGQGPNENLDLPSSKGDKAPIKDLKSKINLSRGVRGMLNLSLGRWAVIFWCVFSVPFVAYAGWSYMEGQVYQAGLQNGGADAANTIYKDIIAKAANEECNTIFVTHENQRVDLVNVRCLELVEEETQE